MHISVIAVDVEEAVSKNGKKYQSANVTFKTAEGKVDSRKVNDMFNKDVFNTLVNAKKGDTFTVEREKNDQGYWNWTSIARQDGPVGTQAQAPVGTPKTGGFMVPVKPTYETPEERAQRQVLIVRQSSVASAVELVKDHGKPEDRSPERVIEIAKRFEQYVFGTLVMDMTDDTVE